MLHLTKNQELELLSALDSRAESPLKFAYIGSSYKKWIDIAQRSRDGHTAQHEENLLKIEALPFIFRDAGERTENINIIDFGCGDGFPILPVLNHARNVGSIRYIAVDISQHMLDQAATTVTHAFPEIEIIKILYDFEKGEVLEGILHLTKNAHTRSYFFLLGNTLGNFDNTEKVLSNLKLSMFADDHLIIGNQISNLFAAPKLIEYYRTREVFDLVSTTVREYGLECSFDEYVVRWNGNQKQIEMLLVAQQEKKMSIHGYTVNFETGEELLLAISRKFAEETLVDIFNRVGFRIDLLTTNKKKNMCIISATPSRYKS